MTSYCRICAGPIENPPDGHDHCIACLGLAHAEAALVESDCARCADLPLRVLRTRRNVARGLLGVRPTAANVLLVGPPPPLESGDDNLARSHRSQRSPQSPVTFTDGCFRPPPSVQEAEEKEEWVGSERNRSDNEGPSDLQEELIRVMNKAVQELELSWNPPEEPAKSKLDSRYFRSSRRQVNTRTSVPFFPDVHNHLVKTWSAPQSARVHSATQAMFSQVDGAEAHGYVRMPPVEETVAAHLCPTSAKTMGSDISLPSKPCRMTAHLASKAYSSAGEGASALHAMAVLQMFQAKLLQSLEGGTASPEALNDLRAATDFALMAMKRTAQAIGRTMGFMVVQQRHLWLTLADLKDADRKVLLNAPITPSGLFGDAVESIIEWFAEAQKRAKAMSHVMPRRSFQPPSRSRSSLATRPPQRREERPAAATAAPRREPDVWRKVWPGPGKRRQGQRRSPRRDTGPPASSKPSS